MKHYVVAYFLVVSLWLGNLHAAPSFAQVCNTLYINWYDNPLRTHDFHDEILHSIQKNDSLFMNQVIEHKASKNQKMMLSAAHIKAAVARNRYDVLNQDGTEFSPAAVEDDAPIMKALDVLKNAQDIKVAQDTVAQDASFFVGNVLQQKKNYSVPLLQKIADSCSSKEVFSYVVRHIKDLQKKLEACVANNQENEECKNRSGQLVARYGALNAGMIKNMFCTSLTPTLHAALLRHCKSELKDELPRMSYEDKKRYVDYNYRELIKIVSDDQASELVMDALSLPAILRDPVVKKRVVEAAFKIDNIIDLLDRLLLASENDGAENRQPLQYHEQCMMPWKLNYDANVVDLVRGMRLSEEDRRILEEKIKNALDDEDYHIVEALFTLCPLLSNKDAKEIEPLLAEIRQKYEIFKDAWTFHRISENFLVAPLNKGTLSSLWHTVLHESFFDPILGHIAYGLTKSKIGDIAANSDNPFVQKVFADHHNQDNPDYHQDGIRAACAHPLILKEALTYLDYLIDRYQTQNERAHKCCICLEPYNALTFQGQISGLGPDAPQPQGKKKIAITYCGENHTMCVACCNNPHLVACPLCREALDVGVKIMHCQICTSAVNDNRFVYCKECDSVGVICDSCSHVPCCKKAILPADAVDKASILKHVETITQRLEQDLAEVIRQQGASYGRARNAIVAEAVQAEVVMSNHRQVLEKRIGELGDELERREKSLNILRLHVSLRSQLHRGADDAKIAAYNKLVVEYNQLLAQHKSNLADTERLRSSYREREVGLNRTCAHNIANLRQSHQTLIADLRALIK